VRNHPLSRKAGPQRHIFLCLTVEESEVRRAVLSFPAGSAGGPDYLRRRGSVLGLTFCDFSLEIASNSFH